MEQCACCPTTPRAVPAKEEEGKLVAAEQRLSSSSVTDSKVGRRSIAAGDEHREPVSPAPDRREIPPGLHPVPS
jgi:hypothetical protein